MAAAAPGASVELLELAADLKHDLGKYVAWVSANLPEERWAGPACHPELMGALRADLLRTRERRGDPEAAWEVWERLTCALPRPLEVPELVRVEAAVAELRAAEPALREEDLAALAPLRPRIRQAQAEIRAALGALHRRLRAEAR